MFNRVLKLAFLAVIISLSTFYSINAQTPKNIRAVDFKNYSYCGGIECSGSFELRNGKSVTSSGESIKLVKVEYADFNGDGQEDAAVAISSKVNGTMGAFGDYYIFTLEDGNVSLFFHIGVEQGEEMRVIDNKLLIDEPEYTSTDPECCPSLTKTTTYQWTIRRRK